MPMLLRVARLVDLPNGASATVKVRGRHVTVWNEDGAFLAAAGKKADPGGPRFRTEARGDFVYVALDPDREQAPADVLKNMRAPEEAAR